MARWSVRLALGLALCLPPGHAAAQPSAKVAPAGRIVLAPTRAVDASLAAVASAVDAALADGALDLGLRVDPGPASDELGQVDRARATGTPVASASVVADGAEVLVRVQLVQPSGAIVARVGRFSRDEAGSRAAIQLRDLVREARAGTSTHQAEMVPAPVAPTAPPAPAAPASNGRTSLAANATLFGGFYGLSIQRSSGSNDPRLLYPLLAVGGGVGLGASLLIAEEWNITHADAWYLAGGMWWPAVAGQLIYAGRFPGGGERQRWTYGLIGGTGGVAIAGLGLTLGPMSDGGAVLVQSGGALGFGFGGLVELFARGDTNAPPLAGMGYGAGLGWLATAALATRLRVTPGRVLAMDVGTLLGGLGGAALGSPLLAKEADATAQRGWVGIVAGSAVLGAGVGLYVSRETKASPGIAASGAPIVGVLGESALGTRRAPIVGIGWRGDL